MFRGILALENRVHLLLEKEEAKREKWRAKALKEMGMKPEPKKAKAITPSQILERFEAMPVRYARPKLVFELVYFMDEAEKVELKDLIVAASQAREAIKARPQPAKPRKPIGHQPAKPIRPLSAKQITEHFRRMRSKRPALVFALSECLTTREVSTLQELLDSEFHARSFKTSDKPQSN